MQLSGRLSEIRPSATLEITTRAKAMKEEGIDVISLAAGEPDFDTPPEIVEACCRSLREGFTRYTPIGGIPELTSAICDKFERDNDLAYTPDQVLVSCGAKHSLFNAFMALLNPGDEVLVPSPAWVSYPEMIRLAGGIAVFVPSSEEDGFLVDPDMLSPYLTSRTKALIINSPCNPTGGAYEKGELEALGEFALRHGLFLISDEIYEKLVFGGFRHFCIASLSPELRASTLVINGFSKSYAMTGWRLGYAAGPTEVIKAMRTIQGHSTSNPTSFAQKGAVAALQCPPEVVGRMVEEFEKRLDFIVGRLSAIGELTCSKPRGTFYAFPNFSGYYGRRWEKGTISSSLQMSAFLLEKAGVALIPGGAFGADDHQRLSFATSLEDLGQAAGRIEDGLKLLA